MREPKIAFLTHFLL